MASVSASSGMSDYAVAFTGVNDSDGATSSALARSSPFAVTSATSRSSTTTARSTDGELQIPAGTQMFQMNAGEGDPGVEEKDKAKAATAEAGSSDSEQDPQAGGPVWNPGMDLGREGVERSLTEAAKVRPFSLGDGNGVRESTSVEDVSALFPITGKTSSDVTKQISRSPTVDLVQTVREDGPNPRLEEKQKALGSLRTWRIWTCRRSSTRVPMLAQVNTRGQILQRAYWEG